MATKSAIYAKNHSTHEKAVLDTKDGARDRFSIKVLIGPLIVSDLKWLTGLPAAGAIERHFFPQLFKARDHGMVAYPGGIRRIERGLSLPSLKRLRDISSGRTTLSRVISSRLVQILCDFAPPADKRWVTEVQHAYGGARWSHIYHRENKGQARSSTMRGLRSLAQKSDVESLATLLEMITVNHPSGGVVSPALVELGSNIQTAVGRLCVFPPFHAARNGFRDYIDANCLALAGLALHLPPDEVIELTRKAVTALGRIGLVPDKFSTQMRLVRWLESQDLQSMVDAAEEVALATGALTLLPGNPLIPVMKHLQHWKTGTGSPIQFDGRANRVFNLANAFDVIKKPYPDELEEIRRPLNEIDLKWHRARRVIEEKEKVKRESAKVANQNMRLVAKSWLQQIDQESRAIIFSPPPIARPRVLKEPRAVLTLPRSGGISRRVSAIRGLAQPPPGSSDQHRFHDEDCPMFAGFDAHISSVETSRMTGLCRCIRRSKLDSGSVEPGQTDPIGLDSGTAGTGRPESQDR